MVSSPELRTRIEEKVKVRGVITAPTLADLKNKCNMDEVSNTQFGKALRSLHYKHGILHVGRPLSQNLGDERSYRLTLRRASEGPEEDLSVFDPEVQVAIGVVRWIAKSAHAVPIEYVEFEYDDDVLGRVSSISRAFGYEGTSKNKSLLAAVNYLSERDEIVVERVLVKPREVGKKIYAAEYKVTIQPN